MKSCAPSPVIARLIASGFGSGLLRGAPGTFGSAAALLFWWMCSRISDGDSVQLRNHLAALCGIVIIGLASTHMVLSGLRRQGNNDPDPQFVVIDEWAGMFAALTGLGPGEAGWAAAAFVAFRVFDIVKPPPIKGLERLPGAWGVMLDDLAAGLYAWGVIVILKGLV